MSLRSEWTWCKNAQTGACPHGERCSRIHNKPTFSQTILLQNLYINPQNSAKTADGSHLANVTDEEMQVFILFCSYIVFKTWSLYLCFIVCICFFPGALWQLLWGCLRWVRGQVWTGRKDCSKQGSLLFPKIEFFIKADIQSWVFMSRRYWVFS